MGSKLQKQISNYLIPQIDNDFQPHSLRTKSVLWIFIIILILENFFFLLAYYLIPSSEFLASLISNSIVQYTNQYRLTSNAPQLTINPLLNEAARLKAEDMAQKGYFSHTSPDNITPWEWLKKVGYDYVYAGENLALNFTDSQEVVEAWLNSESHRQNLLNPNFKEIGIGIAKGTYKNQPAIFIVQFFGTPKLMPNSETNQAKNHLVSPSPLATPIKTYQSPKPTQTPIISPATTKEIPTPETQILAVSPSVTSSDTSFSIKPQSLWASIIQKIIANPKNSLNTTLELFAIFIIIALCLKIFIRIDIQYPALIVNGVLILLVIIFACWLNNYIFNLWPQII
ncbi:MAG: CAP domain-containing protein [Minisyncoccia bacterium]